MSAELDEQLEDAGQDGALLLFEEGVLKLAKNHGITGFRIFCQRFNESTNKTHSRSFASGNWFAMYGQIRMWVMREEEREIDSVRSKDL